MKPHHTTLAAAALVFALTGCATLPPTISGVPANGPTTYAPSQAQVITRVQIGTIIALRAVQIQPSESQGAMASGIGAALGGLLGHQVGRGNGKTAATVAGVLAGGVGGNLAGRGLYTQAGQQITIELEGGGVISVTQAAADQLVLGQRVQILGGGYGRDVARVLPL